MGRIKVRTLVSWDKTSLTVKAKAARLRRQDKEFIHCFPLAVRCSATSRNAGYITMCNSYLGKQLSLLWMSDDSSSFFALPAVIVDLNAMTWNDMDIPLAICDCLSSLCPLPISYAPPAYSLVRWDGKKKRPCCCVNTTQQQVKHKCVTFLVTNPKNSTTQDTIKKIISAKTITKKH